MEKIKNIKINKRIINILIIILLLIILLLLSLKKEEIKNFVSKLLGEEIQKEITYEVYSNENDILKLLIKVIDKENGINEIQIPDGDKIICQGQEKIGFDYEIKEDGEYTIISKSTTGETITKTIVVNEEFRKNIIQINKVQEISTEQDYEITRNVEGYTWYYSIGNNDNWIELPDYNIINIDAYKVKEKEQQDENGKITLNVKRVGESGNTVEVSKLIEDLNIENAIYNNEEQVLEGESLIACVRDNELSTGSYRLKINGEEYPAEVYNYNEDVNYIADKNLGTLEKDNKMLIMKYTKNLNIASERIMTSETRKRGMFVYVEGELINNGEISMTGKGANAQGQDIYLLKNKDNTYEYVPAEGEAGGSGVRASAFNNGSKGTNGNPGNNGVNRSTGGGGSGNAGAYSNCGTGSSCGSGGGSQGTSFSGGSGGGSASSSAYYNQWDFRVYTSVTNGTGAQPNGGAGGNGAEGGTGNPGGTPGGTDGTGGLLILYCNKFNNSKISSNGVDSNRSGGAGASGGGSVNIFYNELINEGTVEAIGGNSGGGGNGGNGSVTIQDLNKLNGTTDESEITNINTDNTNPAEAMPSEAKVIEGDATKGIVIEDNKGNQWTWVEVPKTEVFKTATEASQYEEIKTDLINYLKSPINYRENVDEYFSDEYYEGCGVEAKDEKTAQQVYEEMYQKMLSSIYTNGGFWISRYELGIKGSDTDANLGRTTHTNITDISPEATSQANLIPYNYINCNEAQILASKMLSDNTKTSSLLFGIQKDLVCKYLETKGDWDTTTNIASYYIITDSTSWGNYGTKSLEITSENAKQYISGKWSEITGTKPETGILLTTGASNKTNKMNIYDFSGNLMEWTLEQGTSDKRAPSVYNGGSFSADFSRSSNGPAKYRNVSNSNTYIDSIGARATFY